MKTVLRCSALLFLALPARAQSPTQGIELSDEQLRHLAARALPNGIAIGDFDEDGHLDLLVTNDSGALGLSLFHANGDGTFAAPKLLADSLGYDVTRIASADLDHDHHLDLALFHGNAVTILRGAGKGRFDWAGGAEKGELDPARLKDERDDDGKRHVPSVLLYANLLIVSHGKGELCYTNLALYPHGLFTQDPDGGVDEGFTDDFEPFVPD